MKNYINQEIHNSKINKSVYLADFCHVIDSKIGRNSKVYKDSWVVKSIMKENTFIGDGTKIDNCVLDNYARVGKYNHLYYVELGKHTYTGQDTIIMHTKIGSFTSISWGVTIGAGEHDFKKVTSHSFLYNSYDDLNNGNVYYERFTENCEVGNDVWIGANSTILRGVKIGNGAVIGANSIVTRDVPPYAVIAGNPAKVIKFRFEADIIDRLQAIKWWVLDDITIKKNISLFANEPNHEVLDQIEKEIIKGGN